MRRLVIVGGGSAGWMAAAYLNGALNNKGEKKVVDITLIESPDIPRITVGEASIPSINHVLSVIGLDEATFMKATDATFKQSIKYVNWHKNDNSFYHHPFSRARQGPIDFSGRDWMESKRNIPFMETVSAQPILCEMNLSPKMLGQWTMGPPLKYAFHMNAQKFADYLRDFSVERGVTHILANMKNAKVDNGHIKHVELDNETLVEGDIFIDCTGFKSLLMGKALEVPYDDYSQWLLCDQAIIAAFDYEDYFPGHIRPYTTATALSSGWVWDTPLQSRRSIGYVHSSSFTTEEKAKRELLDYQDPKLKDADTRIIKFKSGQRRKAWSGNCISIGLSGGFIEPLESTGLYFCDLAAVMLAEHFPYRDEDMPQLAYRFNRIISNRYYEVLDFINMHYCLSKRTDTEFWKEVQKPEHITDRLLAKFEHWKIKSPSMADFDDQAFMGFNYNVVADDDMDPRPPVDTAGLWNHESYEAILFGMGWRADEFSDSSKPSRVFPFVMDRLKQAPSKIPPHHIWLHHALGMKPWTGNKVPAGWV